MGYDCGRHEELFIELNSGCVDSRRDVLIASLVKQYTPLIYKTAREYPSLDLNLAKSAALKGFMDSIEKYDYTLGADFAYLAKKYMKSACQKEYRDDRAIHIPHNVIEQIEKVSKKGIFNKDRSELTEEELALLTEVEGVIPVLSCGDLDTPINGSQGDGVFIGDTVSQETFTAPDRGYYLNEVETSLKRLLDQLPTDEKLALIHFNGLFGEEEKTAREVGVIIGMSHQGAINKVRRAEIRLRELALDTEEDLIDTYSLDGIK
jgi:RNA polymerase sigma factor (sigma-70 family)